MLSKVSDSFTSGSVLGAAVVRPAGQMKRSVSSFLLMDMTRHFLAAFVIVFISTCPVAATPESIKPSESSDSKPLERVGTKEDSREKEAEKEKDRRAETQVTDHAMTIGSETVHFRASAGYMTLKDSEKKSK